LWLKSSTPGLRNYALRRARPPIASCPAQSAWSPVHSCGDVFRNRASRSAVSAVMPRLPRMISFSLLSEMPRCLAASSWPSGFKYSSSRISPGGIVGPSQFGSLLIVFGGGFARKSVLPPKRHPVLLIRANAVAARLPRLADNGSGARHRRSPHGAALTVAEPTHGASIRKADPPEPPDRVFSSDSRP